MADEKPVIWMGTSRKDIKALPSRVQSIIGHTLGMVQDGETDSHIKTLRGKDLVGVYEIRADYDKDTYRAVYVVNLGERIFMLHVFQKKSKKGSGTPKAEMDMVRTRLKRAKEIAKELDDEQNR